MGDLSVTHINSLACLSSVLRWILMDREFLKEMGEPLIWDKKQNWMLCYSGTELAGFMCYNSDTICYAYTFPKYRGQGVFSTLYRELPDRDWKVVASNMSLPIFLHKGFTIIKSYKICHKLKKS